MINNEYERNLIIFSQFKAGISADKLADMYGISRARVYAVVSDMRRREDERNTDLYKEAYDSYDGMNDFDRDRSATTFVQKCLAHGYYSVEDIIKEVAKRGTRFLFARQGYYDDAPICHMLKRKGGK